MMGHFKKYSDKLMEKELGPFQQMLDTKNYYEVTRVQFMRCVAVR